eukprot:1684556-Prymnesium_polylepis.3
MLSALSLPAPSRHPCPPCPLVPAPLRRQRDVLLSVWVGPCGARSCGRNELHVLYALERPAAARVAS